MIRPARRGASTGDVGRWSRMRRPRVRPHQPALGGLGTPPYGHYDPCARSSLDASRQTFSRDSASVARDRKKPQQSAERRAFPDRKGKAARLASVPGWLATTPGASQAPAFLGAPLPSRGALKESEEAPGPRATDQAGGAALAV